MSKQQTAVQQLINIVEMDYNNHVEISMKVFLKMLYNSKEMEREQIKDAYRLGKLEATFPAEKLTTSEQYYNETFKKD